MPPKDTHPSFTGQTVIVTGANVGLGFEASVKFVQLGAAKVILAVRTLSKGEEAKEKIEARTGRKGVLDIWHLDMMDYSTIKSFADRVMSKLDRLDIAVLNAGVGMMDFKQSQYGYERTLQVNVISTTLLALLLMPKLRASKTATFTPVMEIVGSTNHFSKIFSRHMVAMSSLIHLPKGRLLTLLLLCCSGHQTELRDRDSCFLQPTKGLFWNDAIQCQ